MSASDEREAAAHTQWRSRPPACDDWREGLGGSNAPSQ